MANTIKTEPVRLAWTPNLINPDEKFKHSSGSPVYHVSMLFNPASLKDLQDKITKKVGEKYMKAMFVKTLGEDKFQVKAKCVAWFNTAQGKTFQKPYIKDMHGKDIVDRLEGEKAIVEIEPKPYHQYGKLALLLKGVQLTEEQPKSREEIEASFGWTYDSSQDHSNSEASE